MSFLVYISSQYYAEPPSSYNVPRKSIMRGNKYECIIHALITRFAAAAAASDVYTIQFIEMRIVMLLLLLFNFCSIYDIASLNEHVVIISRLGDGNYDDVTIIYYVDTGATMTPAVIDRLEYAVCSSLQIKLSFAHKQPVNRRN